MCLWRDAAKSGPDEGAPPAAFGWSPSPFGGGPEIAPLRRSLGLEALIRAPGVRCLFPIGLGGERVVPVFGWIAERCEPPPQWDLRRIGWSLATDPAGAQVRLVD